MVDPGRVDEAALGDQPVADQHWLAGIPGHLLDRLVMIEPDRRRDRILGADIDRRDAGIDAGRGPQFARRREDVAVRRHVGVEVLEIEPGVGQRAVAAILSAFFACFPEAVFAAVRLLVFH